MGHRLSKEKDSKMRKTKFLTLIAIFVALFMNFGTLFAQSEITFEHHKILNGHSYSVFSVCWSPDGKYLASGSNDGTVIIWDANSGQRLKTLQGHSESVNSVSWSPDGKYLASGSGDKTIIIWELN